MTASFTASRTTFLKSSIAFNSLRRLSANSLHSGHNTDPSVGFPHRIQVVGVGEGSSGSGMDLILKVSVSSEMGGGEDGGE